MKKMSFIAFAMLFSLTSCFNDDNSNNENTDYFAVANRGDGTVSLYNASTQNKEMTITLDDANAAPTYVTYSYLQDRMYVADFNNQKIVAYDASNFTKVAEYATGQGSFHMWLSDYTNQLWVNNIVDKTTSVIDIQPGNTIATLNLPNIKDLADDAAQHDVIISPNGRWAYVSIFSQTGQNYVVQYRTHNQTVKKIIEVGGDPHLTVTQNRLYILSQDDSNILEYRFNNLQATGRGGSMMNAHGVTPGKNRNIFITDLTGRKVGSYKTNTQVTAPITDASATSGVAHNLAYNPNDNVLALTISGGNTVEFFRANGRRINPLSTDVSGANPFGIVFIDR